MVNHVDLALHQVQQAWAQERVGCGLAWTAVVECRDRDVGESLETRLQGGGHRVFVAPGGNPVGLHGHHRDVFEQGRRTQGGIPMAHFLDLLLAEVVESFPDHRE